MPIYEYISIDPPRTYNCLYVELGPHSLVFWSRIFPLSGYYNIYESLSGMCHCANDDITSQFGISIKFGCCCFWCAAPVDEDDEM